MDRQRVRIIQDRQQVRNESRKAEKKGGKIIDEKIGKEKKRRKDEVMHQKGGMKERCIGTEKNQVILMLLQQMR
jgi:hypothetical protein